MKLRSLLITLAMTVSTGLVSAQEILIAVNEGVTYQDGGPASERYKPLLQILSRELKQDVKLQTVDKYAALEKGLSEGKYGLAFIHPAHIGLQAVRQHGYVGLATAKGFTEYRARVLVSANSPLKSMQELRGKKIGVPSLESITTVMFAASLREMNITQPEKNFTATRYQDAVPFMIDNGFVDAGVTGSAAVAQAWTTKGGRILGETRPVAIKQFIASGKLTEADRAKVKRVLLSLSEDDAGKAILQRIGLTGFLPWDDRTMKEAALRLGL